MSSLDALVVLISLAVSLGLYLYQRNVSAHSDLPLPPGPKPLPFLGNMFDMPASYEYETYRLWGKEYGDVVHVSALGKHLIILNSVAVANELLDVRSAIYSDRPILPMLHEPDLMDSGWTFTFKQYSPEWRRHRRLFTQHLNPIAARAFFGTQTASAHTLLRSMLQTPDGLVIHLRHAAAETIMSIAYGYQVKSTNDPWVEIADRMVRTVGEGVRPGGYLVNVFPSLKHIPAWFPGAEFKDFAAKARKAGRDVLELPFEDAKKRIDAGTAAPSFVTSALTDGSPDDLISDIKEVAATMYGPASDTTVSTELDTVLGSVTSSSFRLPTYEDRPQLPYVDAIVKESLRWLPVVATGIPHATMQEDIYRGWRIPKGSIVIANAWSMLRDESIYPDPFTFHPERFLGENPAPHPGSNGCFGFGRRECPGRHLAEAALWIQISSLLAAFNFSPAKDKDGRDIDVNYARTPAPGLLAHPQAFPCTVTPRSKVAAMRIRETHPDQVI